MAQYTKETLSPSTCHQSACLTNANFNYTSIAYLGCLFQCVSFQVCHIDLMKIARLTRICRYVEIKGDTKRRKENINLLSNVY